MYRRNWANRPCVRLNRSRIYDSRGELVAIDDDDATLSYCDATLKLNTNVCETILSDEQLVVFGVRSDCTRVLFSSHRFHYRDIISPPLSVINARRCSSAGLDLENNIMCIYGERSQVTLYYRIIVALSV